MKSPSEGRRKLLLEKGGKSPSYFLKRVNFPGPLPLPGFWFPGFNMMGLRLVWMCGYLFL
jgi:hypothetical protein